MHRHPPVSKTPLSKRLSGPGLTGLAWALTASAYAATWVVAPWGDDDAAGDGKRPFETISRAADQALPGDIVRVREGVYRERVAPPRGGEQGRPITYQAAPGERVVVKGSEVWRPDWRAEGDGVYSAAPDKRLFDDKSPEYVDHHNPLRVRLASTPDRRNGLSEAVLKAAGEDRLKDCDERIAYTCGQLFVNGEWYREAPLQDELTPGRWWYERNSGKVHVHFGGLAPSQQHVELTTRRRIFAPKTRGLGHIVVEGFVFEHAGNQYPTNFWKDDANAQKGAVGTEAGHHWIIRRNVIRHAKTFALDVGRVDRHSSSSQAHNTVVEENYIIDNGSAGVLSNGSENLTIRGNVILRNNRLRFFGVKRWEQAGIKCHQFRDGLIEGNYIAEQYESCGVWLDNQFPGCRVTRNVLRGNGQAGIFLEMSDYDFERLLIDNNVLLDNHKNAVYIHDASGAAFVNNLFANTCKFPGYGQAIYIRQLTTRTCAGRHSFYDNLLIGNARNVEVNYPAGRSDVHRFDGNVYAVAPNANAFGINPRSDKPVPWSDEEFRALVAKDVEGQDEDLVFSDSVCLFTLNDWRRFWDTHNVSNDRTSRFAPGSSVAYNATTHELTVDLTTNLGAVKASGRDLVDRDYFGEPRPSARAVPGPFQSLGSGSRTLQIWDGLPLLVEDQLPAPNWNESLKRRPVQ